ncbi:plasma kallikrein-like protein, partial [Leptotrombidium deliense]
DNKTGLQPSDLKISVGTHRLSEVKPHDEYFIDKIIPHENYYVGSGGELVAGWGRAEENDEKSDVLGRIDVLNRSNNECKQNFKDMFSPKEMFCAGRRKGSKLLCLGDSGGAVVKRRRGQSYLAGIISSRIGCSRNECQLM